MKHKVENIKVKRKLAVSEKARITHNPFQTMFIEVLKQHAIDLPLLEMVKNSTLQINNYFLTSGHAQALRAGLQKCADRDEQFFNSICLSHNQLQDADFASILEGLSSLPFIKRLEYKNNTIGELSVDKLGPLL